MQENPTSRPRLPRECNVRFMSFFHRRKILKTANFLDLTPVRVMDHELNENGNVTILLPRFRKKLASTLLQPRSKSKFITIRLDQFGSETWLLIDGQRNVADISNVMKKTFPGEFLASGEADERVTKFLSLLYDQRYITFVELQHDRHND